MAGQALSTLTALLRENVAPGVNDLLFRQTDLLNFLRANGRVSDGVGPAPFSWNVVTSANSSTEVFTEGQAPPAAGSQTFVRTSLNPFYVRGVCGRTGHVRDNQARGGYYADPLAVEQMLLEADVMKKLEDTLVGSTQDQGLAAIIDATGTYANLAQGTYASWASEENAVSGALTLTALQTLYEEMTLGSVSSVPRAATPTHWLMPVEQFNNYVNLAGPNASTSLYRFGPGQTPDFTGYGGAMLPTCSGLPLVQVRTLTNTEVYLVDVTDIELLVHRDLRLDPIVGNPENEQWQLSFAVALKVARRNKHGKMTGVTA